MSIEDEAEQRKIASIEEARAKKEKEKEAADPVLDSQKFGEGARFELRKSGVYFVEGEAGQKGDAQWLCAPLHVIAQSRSKHSACWGRLLEWHDDDGTQHLWAMPVALLQGDGAEVRRELAALGLTLTTGKKGRERLLIYLQSWKVAARARCVERLGWCGKVYVLPDVNVGDEGAERVVFQSDEAVALHALLEVTGTVDDWRTQVMPLVRGNSRLLLAMSAGCAGPLLDPMRERGVGLHLRGASSLGKTTALHVAASIWGDPKTVVHSWRTTDNGAEGVAALHNDRLLVLDEISQVEPRAAGQLAYMLANGQGKQRSSRAGNARDVRTWNLLFLSSGEQSLASKLAEDRRRVSAGQELRLLDIPADAGAGFGLFDTLHDFPDGQAFAHALHARTAQCYGTVARAFIERLVANRADAREHAKATIGSFNEHWIAPGDSAQVGRARSTFALIAAAGELATHYGLTGLEPGDAAAGVGACFDDWRREFTEGGTGSHEAAEALREVRAFVEKHGAARFVDLDHSSAVDDRLRDRAGFTTCSGGVRRWLFLTETFRREVCGGLDYRLVARALRDAGWLRTSDGGRLTTRETVPGLGRVRVYVVQLPDEA